MHISFYFIVVEACNEIKYISVPFVLLLSRQSLLLAIRGKFNFYRLRSVNSIDNLVPGFEHWWVWHAKQNGNVMRFATGKKAKQWRDKRANQWDRLYNSRLIPANSFLSQSPSPNKVWSNSTNSKFETTDGNNRLPHSRYPLTVLGTYTYQIGPLQESSKWLPNWFRGQTTITTGKSTLELVIHHIFRMLKVQPGEI